MSAPVLTAKRVTRRGGTNSNERGGSDDRAARRAWLVTTYGAGGHVLCFHCRVGLTVDTVSCDRIRPKVEGGSYRRENIRPACVTCNSRDGARLRNRRRHGVGAPPVKLTAAQMRALIRIRCTPFHWESFTGRHTRTLDTLARLGLVHWWYRSNGAAMVPVAVAVQPLIHEGVTL